MMTNFSHTRAYSLSGLLLACLLTNSAQGQEPFFIGLGDLPGGTFYSFPDDISADGTVVTGSSRTESYEEIFRWTRTAGMVGLGIRDGSVNRVSADGSTVVAVGRLGGACDPNIFDCANFRWSTYAGLEPLPIVPNGVSGDGTLMVGSAYEISIGAQAGLWTETGGVAFLPIGIQHPDNSFASDVSADGTVVLGAARRSGAPSWDLFIYVLDEGTTWLNLPSPWWGDSTYLEISDNGNVVTGRMGDTAANRRGFRWTKETGAVELGHLPDGPWMGAAGASADGSIIVGNSQNVSPQRMAIWDAAHGPRYLDDILANELGLGGAMAGWSGLITFGISGDGRSVFGQGTNPNGNTEGWIAYMGSAVPEPTTSCLAVIMVGFFACCRKRRIYRC